MYPIRLSPEHKEYAGFRELPRVSAESNLEWFERARSGLEPGVTAAILLFGGAGVEHFRLRVAQSVARHDLTPSHWSHVALIDHVDKPWKKRTRLWEIPLTPIRGFAWPPKRNALNPGHLGDYASPGEFPNVALIGVPANLGTLHEQMHAFERRPLEVDAVSLLSEWLAYLWGASEASNPLDRGLGLPSAVMVETIISAAWQDLSPGLASLASCPEAIWQAAKHWSSFHELAVEVSGSSERIAEAPKVLTGYHHAAHRLVPDSPARRPAG